MTLRKKSLLLIGGVLLALLGALYFMAVPIVLDGFLRVEKQGMTQVVQGASVTLSEVSIEFDNRCRDWAAWDDSYKFVQDGNKKYIADNLHKDFFLGSKVDLVVYLNLSGKIVYATAMDDKKAALVALPEEISRFFSNSRRLTNFKDIPEKHIGIVPTSRGPLLLVIRPIITSKYQGPIHGALVFGRYLTPKTLATLARAGNYSFDFAAINHSMPTDFALAWQRIQSNKAGNSNAISVEPINESTVGGYTVLNDIYGYPGFLLRATGDRKLYHQGASTLHYFFLALGAIGLIFAVLAIWPIERFVLSRLSRLGQEVEQIRTHRDLSARVTIEGHDELSQLSSDINTTLAALEELAQQKTQSEELYRELSETARNTGDAMFIAFPYSTRMKWYGDVTALFGDDALETREQWINHVHPDDRATLEQALIACGCGTAPFNIELRILPRGAETVYWLVRGKALCDESGQMLRIIGVCLDITERKKVEADRLETEERLTRIVETNADAILVLDADGRFTFANAAAETIFGLTREEILQRSYNDTRWQVRDLNGLPLPAEQRPFSLVRLLDSPVQNIEFSLLNSQGKRVMLSVNASPLHNAEGELNGVVTNITDITERKALQERLVYQAFHDPLTGLPNRALLSERLEHALNRSARSNAQTCVAFIDVDNFKYVNDTIGHALGDQVLTMVAERLQSSLRVNDTAARFGGDEFVVLLEDIETPRQALVVIERMLSVLHEPVLIEGREIFVTPSIGVAFSQGEKQLGGDLLKQADIAMYEAKRRGKARYEIFEAGLSQMALHRLEIENDMRRALQRNEFVLHYQPKIDLSSNQIYGFEALVRWQHPRNGLMMPSEFLSIAEETGLIEDLGLWILREACHQADEWQHVLQNGEIPVMSVNISGRQLKNPRLPELVASILSETGIAAETLQLEITEHSFLQQSELMYKTLNSLKEMGVQLAIDDFGMGYSSLSYLRRLPPNVIKIDRRFVSDLSKSPGENYIVESMIGLAHALNMGVVAAGAETLEEVQQLQKLGCNMVQGYYFARPMNKYDAASFLREPRVLSIKS